MINVSLPQPRLIAPAEVGVTIVNPDHKVLFYRQPAESDRWRLPMGWLKLGNEKPEIAAKRIVRDILGVKLVDPTLFMKEKNIFVHYPPSWEGRPRVDSVHPQDSLWLSGAVASPIKKPGIETAYFSFLSLPIDEAEISTRGFLAIIRQSLRGAEQQFEASVRQPIEHQGSLR